VEKRLQRNCFFPGNVLYFIGDSDCIILQQDFVTKETSGNLSFYYINFKTLFYNKILSPKKLLEICLFITSTLKVDFSFSFLFFDSFLKAKFSETNFVS